MKNRDDIYSITAGTFLMAVGVNSFFETHNLVIGGASGLAILISSALYRFFALNPSMWLLFLSINIPLFLAGFIVMGFKKLKKSLYATVMLSAMLWVTAFIPPFDTDLAIAAVFGGIIEGLGLGLVLKTGFTTGGSDLLATILNIKFPSLSVSFLILVIDYVIIALGFWEFGSLNAFYAIVSVFIAVKVMDIVITGAGYAKAVYVISDKYEEIGRLIMEKFERGVTTLKGRGEYTKKEKNVILCVVAKKQVAPLKRLILSADDKAFLIITEAAEVTGEGFTRK
ncbi:MAG: YitT family protein [Clostridiales bacterium]|nr:YitT family protein [Clostridiales bacterium]